MSPPPPKKKSKWILSHTISCLLETWTLEWRVATKKNQRHQQTNNDIDNAERELTDIRIWMRRRGELCFRLLEQRNQSPWITHIPIPHNPTHHTTSCTLASPPTQQHTQKKDNAPIHLKPRTYIQRTRPPQIPAHSPVKRIDQEAFV